LDPVADDNQQVACHRWAEIAPMTNATAEIEHSQSAEARFALYREAIEGGSVSHRTTQPPRT
jgi:hypothetical protein